MTPSLLCTLLRLGPTAPEPEPTAPLTCWRAFARPEQLRPADCRKIWNLQAGRGFGKTRAGAEHTLDMMELWGTDFAGGISNKTRGDVRAIMIDGRSGLLQCQRRRGGPELVYLPSQRLIRHPNGAKLSLYSGDVEGDTRGPEFNFFWGDELPHWQYAGEEFDNIYMATRVDAPAPGPHIVLTSTPKRRSIISGMLLDPKWQARVTTTYGATADNIANLAQGTVEDLVEDYRGTWKYRQELLGELIEDSDGGFTLALIDRYRQPVLPTLELREIVVSIDPAVTSKTTSDDTGMVVIAVGEDEHAYVLEDCTVSSTAPGVWAMLALRKCAEYRERYDCPTRIVIEVNQGGDVWDDVVFPQIARQFGFELPRITCVHASRSKIERADAAAFFFEAGRVHHIGGGLGELETQMTRWVPGQDSPDRMDALVHGILETIGVRSVGPLF